MDRALLALGRLDSVTILLPEAPLLLYAYVRKEAVLSSRIDGKSLSMLDLLLWELEEEVSEVAIDGIRETSNYVAALEHGLRRVRKGFPVSGRLLREMHGILLADGSNTDKQPGEFRTPEHLPDCMEALDRFLHDDPERFPVLIKAALAHAQFVTLHPFMNGNGRLGRLLITLLLGAEGALQEPLLPLSLHFEQHRTRYFDLLQRTRTEGDWESWLIFFVTGVRETADHALTSARKIVELFQADRVQIRTLGRAAGSALAVHQVLQRRPVTSIKHLASETNLTIPTVTAALHALEEPGIAGEITGRQRNRLYSYPGYLEILSEE